jgi:hypothetical protein
LPGSRSKSGKTFDGHLRRIGISDSARNTILCQSITAHPFIREAGVNLLWQRNSVTLMAT